MAPKFGRRAGNEEGGESSAHTRDNSARASAPGGGTHSHRPTDRVLQADKLRTVDDGVDRTTSEQAMQRAVEQKERIVRSVAEAPVAYSMPMPKLAELDITNQWSEFLQSISQEVDMPALTSCLVQNLDDEDVPWNPDMLLVQLTSDMLDAAEALDANPVPGKTSTAEDRRRKRAILEDPESFVPAGQHRLRRADSLSKGAGDSAKGGTSRGSSVSGEGGGKAARSQGKVKSQGDSKQGGALSPLKKRTSSKNVTSAAKPDARKASHSKEGRTTSSASSTKSKGDARVSSAKGTSASKSVPEAK